MSRFDPLEVFDGWELREKLEHARRVLALAPPGEARDSTLWAGEPKAYPIPGTASSSRADWVLTKSAVAAITCGGVLAGWWWFAHRHDLMRPALAFLALGHLAWFAKWCYEANRRWARSSRTPRSS